MPPAHCEKLLRGTRKKNPIRRKEKNILLHIAFIEIHRSKPAQTIIDSGKGTKETVSNFGNSAFIDQQNFVAVE
jgi:hypothetical protein